MGCYCPFPFGWEYWSSCLGIGQVAGEERENRDHSHEKEGPAS